MYKTRLYECWNSMISRCFNKNTKTYVHYGARGITVCDDWKNDFKKFYNWATHNGYQDNLTLDRINVNGNYEPSNCRWIEKKEQPNNRRNSIRIKYNGNYITMKEMSEITGLKYSQIQWKRKKGELEYVRLGDVINA